MNTGKCELWIHRFLSGPVIAEKKHEKIELKVFILRK